MRIFLTLVLIGLVTASCSPSAHLNPDPPEAANSTSILPEQTQGTQANATPAPADERYLDLAKQDLATRLKIGIDQIAVAQRNRRLAGIDLSSGCSRKAGQVLMPNDSANGYQISLAAQGRNYLYHAGMNDQLVMCQDGA